MRRTDERRLGDYTFRGVIQPLGPRLKHQIERRFACSPEARESAGHDDFAEAAFTGLRSQPETDFLGQRRRGANHGGSRVHDAANGVVVLLRRVAREGFDDHPNAISLQGLKNVPGGADRIAHIVQTIEKGHQIVAAVGRIILRTGDVKGDTLLQALLDRPFARGFDRSNYGNQNHRKWTSGKLWP